MYLGGFALGWLGARVRSARPGSPVARTQVDDLIFFIALGVFIGGRVGYMLVYNFGGLIENPLSLLFVWQGGMSFHGGLVGVLVAMWLLGRRIGQPFFVVTDFIAPWVPIGLGLGRIGNFVNGELWGKPTSPDAPWAVIVDGQARHASQLYEALLEGVVMFVVLWLFSQRPRPTMAVSGLFLTLYGVFRIVVEFIRLPDDPPGYLAFGWVTLGQVLSVPMVVAGVALLALAYRGTPARAAA